MKKLRRAGCARFERLKRLPEYKPVPIAKFPDVHAADREMRFEHEDEDEETVMNHSN